MGRKNNIPTLQLGYLPHQEHREWGEKIISLPWENWQFKSKLADEPNYQQAQRWVGAIEGPAPAVVFEKPWECNLQTMDLAPINLTESGMLQGAPHYLRFLQKTCQQLQDEGIVLETENLVEDYQGSWMQLGKWWETPQKTGKIWLKIRVGNQWLLVVKYQRKWWLMGSW
ncbi:hypothetical protein HMPREF0044_1070 [Gleimia coleocanis DSM 15436]|uniref:Uncharacterized protein n=1 Tax=Gleimia coleocanis DSM 15436 TaxID=525245 RepID=C0W0J2_9ACTO|nr:hypothetical protein [Gleimia coleocanis]EEH64051.1 hypothetical protein HMPREF0044_1070 [Gleimia coleocanis DSM 15436]